MKFKSAIWKSRKVNVRDHIGIEFDSNGNCEINVKDEASHIAEVEVPQDVNGDLDMTADIAADEFVMLDGDGNPTDDDFTSSSDDDATSSDDDDLDNGVVQEDNEEEATL
jgi:hypothetical protein